MFPTVRRPFPLEPAIITPQFRRQAIQSEHRPVYRHFRRRIASNESFEFATILWRFFLVRLHPSVRFRRFLFRLDGPVEAETGRCALNCNKSWFKSAFSRASNFEWSITRPKAAPIL